MIKSKRLKVSTEITNASTGELVESKKVFNVKVESAEFYITFLEIVSFIHNIKGEFPLLAILCMNSEFNTGKCFLSADRRKIFAEQLGLTSGGFRSALFRLEKKGAIKNNNGTIEINPLYLWKGSVEERNKALKQKGIEVNFKFRSDEFSDTEKETFRSLLQNSGTSSQPLPTAK